MNSLLSIFLLSLMQMLGVGQQVDLLFAGDAMQHKPQSDAAYMSKGVYDYSQCFKYLETDIKAADYAVVNLECPLAGVPYTGYPAFSAPEAFAKQLHELGFDFFLTANNHCLDRRDAGLRRTINALDKLNISHAGTYVSRAERMSQVPYITTINGVKFAMLDYTYGTNGIPIQGSVVVNYIDRDMIAADIDRSRELGAEVVCVNLHWGIEYKLLPVDSQRSLADFLIDKGADLIIGGHPHVVEPMEIRHSEKYDKDVLLVYSLGNFISNQNGDDSRGGAMVKVSLTVLDGKMTAVSARYKLFFCQKPQRRGENFMLIPWAGRNLVRSDSRAAFDLFMTRARQVLDANNINVPEER